MFNKNKFIIKKVIKKEDYLTFEYDVLGDIRRFFWLGEMFNVQYYDVNIENVPDSIAVVPLVANVLPIIWVNNATLYVDELDKDFYDCINTLKKSYQAMLPMLKFKGKLKVKKLVKNNIKDTSKTACFFTGGIDSYSTYISNKNKKPDFITVWGADIDYENVEGFKNVKKYINKVAKSEKANNIFIHASIRRFIDNSELEKAYFNIINDNWWNSMQHGIGIISLSAPLSYVNGYNTIYFASTYTEEERKMKKIICASVPEIDENLKIANVSVIHDGYDFTRMQKVINICNYKKKEKRNIIFHVCYRSKEGVNCCKCEKCYRTICELLSEGEDPNEYGLEYNSKLKKEMIKYMNENKLPDRTEMLWIEIVDNLNTKKKLNKFQKELDFIYDIEFINNYLNKTN